MNKKVEQVIIHGLVCPVPLAHAETIVIGHGSGGRMTQRLIEQVIYPALENPILLRGDDGAVVSTPAGDRLAISTDVLPAILTRHWLVWHDCYLARDPLAAWREVVVLRHAADVYDAPLVSGHPLDVQ